VAAIQLWVSQLFSVNSIWFFVLQAVIWLGVCLVIVMSMDTARPERSYGSLKTNLGYFLAFVAMSGTLLYIVFGRTPMG
jgi:hypothetical protein